MAWRKQIEFAEICGIKRNALGVNIERGKVLIDSKTKMVDDENPVNVAFMEKQKANARKKAEKQPPVAPPVAEMKATEQEMPPKKDKNTSKSSEDYTSLRKHLDRKQELETAKLEEEAERMRTQTRILRLQEERALGKMVPTDVIKSLYAQHFKSLTTSFMDAINVIVPVFSKRAKLNRNDEAEFRGELITAMNSAVNNAITMSTKQIGAIVTEYSQAKK